MKDNNAPYTGIFSNPSGKLKSFIYGIGVQGLVWGLGLGYFQYHLPIVYEAILCMLVITAMAVAMISFSTSKIAFFVFLLSVVIPQIISLIIQVDELHIKLSLFMIAGCVIISIAYTWNYNRLTRGIEFRFENENIMDTLKQANENLETSNVNLQRLQYQLTNASLTDELTGIANRRHFNQHFEIEWRRAQRNQESMTYCMIDVDYFKNYNDSYGHQQGDECLKIVAQKIRSHMKRPADMTARYGGEEFVVLLPDTPLEAAVELAHIIQESILAHQ